MEHRDHHYDAIAIDFDKGGKTLAAALGAAGKRTAVIEKETLTGKLRELNFRKLIQMSEVVMLTGRARFISPHKVKGAGEKEGTDGIFI